MASHPLSPNAPGSRFPRTQLRVFSSLTQGDFRRFDPQPHGCGRQPHTHCSFARGHLTPFRLTRTRQPCRGQQPSLATTQTLREPFGYLRTQRGRCFFPTSATGSRHEYPPNRPTLARGSSPQPTRTRATGACGSPADSTLIRPKPRTEIEHDRRPSRRVIDVTRPASARSLFSVPLAIRAAGDVVLRPRPKATTPRCCRPREQQRDRTSDAAMSRNRRHRNSPTPTAAPRAFHSAPRQEERRFQPGAPSTIESPNGLAPFRVLATFGLSTFNPHRCLLTRVIPGGKNGLDSQFRPWALHPETAGTEHRSLASAILTIHEHKPRISRAPRISPVARFPPRMAPADGLSATNSAQSGSPRSGPTVLSN